MCNHRRTCKYVVDASSTVSQSACGVTISDLCFGHVGAVTICPKIDAILLNFSRNKCFFFINFAPRLGYQSSNFRAAFHANLKGAVHVWVMQGDRDVVEIDSDAESKSPRSVRAMPGERDVVEIDSDAESVESLAVLTRAGRTSCVEISSSGDSDGASKAEESDDDDAEDEEEDKDEAPRRRCKYIDDEAEESNGEETDVENSGDGADGDPGGEEQFYSCSDEGSSDDSSEVRKSEMRLAAGGLALCFDSAAGNHGSAAAGAGERQRERERGRQTETECTSD